MLNKLIILGTHGIPARYGGFETFAEKLALYLKGQQWDVTVFGQSDHPRTENWQGIQCIYLKKRKGLLSYLDPVLYDLESVLRACFIPGIVLTLGYNTALFNLLLWVLRRRQMINMDGIEWKRSKYKHWHEKAWLRFNEWIALKIGKPCIADHAEIARYILQKSPNTPIVTLPYGADIPDPLLIQPDILLQWNVQPGRYGLVIARAEPENQIAEIVAAWTNKNISLPLLVLGHYQEQNPYHRRVKALAGKMVHFTGALYDPVILATLRHYCGIYLHGHTVGGTNPSLVEAMAAGCPIVLHDNPFNRGVAGNAALYFHKGTDLDKIIDQIIGDETLRTALRESARQRHQEHYRWEPILASYRTVLAGRA